MKQSELLRKQADMMDMAEKYGVEDWSFLVKIDGKFRFFAPNFCATSAPIARKYEFALGVVEGEPVFEGDTLWLLDGTSPISITKDHNIASGAWSWAPPKPKTVTVELLREDAEYYGDNADPSSPIAQACRKALEEQK